MYCPNCGKKLPDISKYCSKCGKPIMAFKNSNATNINNSKIKTKNNIVRPVLGILAVIAGIIIFVVIIHAVMISRPSQTSPSQSEQPNVSSTNPPGVYSVDEAIQIFNKNRIREENTIFTIRGVFENISVSSSQVYIHFQRSDSLLNATDPFSVWLNRNNIPSEIYNIAPGDIITVRGNIKGQFLGYSLENSSLINFEKRYDFIHLEEYTGRQFYDRITANPLWADGKTFRIKGGIRSISEHQGRIIIRIDGAHEPLTGFYMDNFIEPFIFIFDNRWKCTAYAELALFKASL